MSDPDEPDTTTAEPVATPSPTTRQSGWTCSLPREILSVILELLVEDKALRAIANVQSASSAMYTLATPYLYREIHLHPQTALKLFGQFGDFARTDSRLFHEAVPPDIHLVDLHICHRLRAFCAHTRRLSFRLLEGADAFFSDKDVLRLRRYTELVCGLTAFEYPGLWPKLDIYEINLYIKREIRPTFWMYGDVVEAIFINIQAKTIILTMPAFSSTQASAQDSVCWNPWIESLHADKITLPNFPLSFPPWRKLPIASKTLTIECRDEREGRSRIEMLKEFLLDSRPFSELDHLIVKGIFYEVDNQMLNPEGVYTHLDPLLSTIMRARAAVFAKRGQVVFTLITPASCGRV